MEPVSNSNRPSFPASAPRRCALALPHLQVPSTVLRALSSRRAVFAVRTRYGLFSVLVRARVGGLEAKARQKRSICAINVDGFKRGDVGKRRCCAHVTPGKRAARWTSRINAHRSTGWTGHPRDCGEDGEEEQEAGGRVASGNHRQKSSQSLKATKKRRYYPASYVGLFWKSLDIYFPITSKVTAPRDFIYFFCFIFLNVFFCDRTRPRVWLRTCPGCCSSCQRRCRRAQLFYLGCSAASYGLQLPQCHWRKEGDGNWTGGSRESDVHSVGVYALMFESEDCTGMETGTTDCLNIRWVSTGEFVA